MRVNLVTLHPEFFDSPLKTGLMGKAVASGLLEIAFHNPRDYALDNYKSVDDKPFGGGVGMVMKPEVLGPCLDAVGALGRGIVLSASGRRFDQKNARELAAENTLTLVCGRFEGIDERVAEHYSLEPLGVGDYILNGGETAALCVLEAVGRLIPGFMGKEASGETESFETGLLEHPHYTRPETWRGLSVPPALVSGDHARIDRFRRRESLARTLAARPELLEAAAPSPADAADLKDLATGRPRIGRNLFVAQVHHPVLNSRGEIGVASLTNLDLHDIARVSRSYGLGGYFVVTPLEDQQRLARRLLDHWTGGERPIHADRAEALSTVTVVDAISDAAAEVEKRTGMRPTLAATSARVGAASPAKVRELLGRTPVLLLLGGGSGLAPEAVEQCDFGLTPLRFLSDYNHLSVRAAAAILIDRILGELG